MVRKHKPFSEFQKIAFVDLVKSLSLGEKINAVNKHGETLLHRAVLKNIEGAVPALLERRAEIDKTVTKTGQTSLHLAILGHHHNIIDLLLDKGANVYMDTWTKSPINLALTRKRVKVLERLLDRGVDVNYKDRDGNSLLHIAVTKSENQVVDLLLARGAEVNVTNCDGDVPLTLAINNRIIKKLLNNGADLEHKNNDGQTPLHKFVKRGFSLGVELALERGAQINVKDNLGNTPLHSAVQMRKIELTKSLVYRGADINQENKDDETSLYCALLSEEFDEGKYFLIQRRAKNILKYNALKDPLHFVCSKSKGESAGSLDNWEDVNVKDEQGLTLLHYAVLFKNEDLVKQLLEKGAEVNVSDNRGRTPLHLAVRVWKTGFDLLLERGADVNVKDNLKRTLLHYDVVYGRYKSTKILLAKGVTPGAQDSNGQTPLHLAIGLGPIDPRQVFLERGELSDGDNDNYSSIDLNTSDCIIFEELVEHFIRLKLVNLEFYEDNQDSLFKDCEAFHEKKLYTAIRWQRLRELCLSSGDHLPPFGTLQEYKLLYESLCVKELERIKLYNINQYSLYSVFKNYDDPMYGTNSSIEEKIYSTNLLTEYPIFASLLRLTFQRAKVRHTLMDMAELNPSIISGDVVTEVILPNEVKRKILSFLNDKDVKNLLIANNNSFNDGRKYNK